MPRLPLTPSSAATVGSWLFMLAVLATVSTVVLTYLPGHTAEQAAAGCAAAGFLGLGAALPLLIAFGK